ncbi:hypothetical protein CDAR_278081 [Caerostris darwini]|uniref:Uncharacterized protein n=1 Tax=Caerostris darwini TaxID=1538125 RepID=A0AAV4S7G2_9ARAC|nr:hypothetical protein CDAR_278081 [Caerostris darwini]
MIASSSSPEKRGEAGMRKGEGSLTKGSATRYITDRRTRENTMRFDEKEIHTTRPCTGITPETLTLLFPAGHDCGGAEGFMHLLSTADFSTPVPILDWVQFVLFKAIKACYTELFFPG